MRGPETQRMHLQRAVPGGFYDTYMSGKGLDIGYKGSLGDKAEPVLLTATGVDIDYPGYDGITLPFADESQDYVFASHVLEHLAAPYKAIKEWYRVLKVDGYMIIMVPHRDLYEKKLTPPSRFNPDHKRFYTTGDLINTIELSLPPNSYRVRHCKDNDPGYTYDIPPEQHCGGACEIECVIQKIKQPTWVIK